MILKGITKLSFKFFRDRWLPRASKRESGLRESAPEPVRLISVGLRGFV